MRKRELWRLPEVELALDERVGNAGVRPREPGLLEERQHRVVGELVRQRWQARDHLW